MVNQQWSLYILYIWKHSSSIIGHCYLEFTDFNYNEIARDIKSRYNISIDRHTISGINNGTCYALRLCELGYEYFPIR